MKKYRGFVGQVPPLSGMGITGRESIDYATRYAPSTNKISPPSYLQEPSPILQPPSGPYVPSPWINGAGPVLVSPAQQELEYRQYAEGGDGQADILEKTAKIDEAIQRATGGSGAPPAAPGVTAGTPNLLPLALGAALIYFMM